MNLSRRTMAFVLLLQAGCAADPTPMERARATCTELGDPSPACLERRLNIEQAREDEFTKRANEHIRALTMPSSTETSQAPLVGIPIVPLTGGYGTTPAQPTNYDQQLQQMQAYCAARNGHYVPGLRGGGGCTIP